VTLFKVKPIPIRTTAVLSKKLVPAKSAIMIAAALIMIA